MTFGSLFAGIGGMDLGLERAGMECLWQVEIDPFCTKVLERHWPNVKRYGDIRELSGSQLDEVDLIAGGDPCQENSNARQNTGLDQPSLGADFIRVVTECRPRLVLRENPSAVRADAPWPWFRFRCELERLGYIVLPFRLRACCFGADHRRDRLFLLGHLSDAVQAGLQGAEFGEVEGESGEAIRHTSRSDRWSSSPRICRAVDGIPNRVDRLKGLGNAVVPQVAEWIGCRIMAVETKSPSAWETKGQIVVPKREFSET